MPLDISPLPTPKPIEHRIIDTAIKLLQRGWCQGTAEKRYPNQHREVCASRAFQLACYEEGITGDGDVAAMARKFEPAIGMGWNDLIVFNDCRARDVSDVIGIFERARSRISITVTA